MLVIAQWFRLLTQIVSIIALSRILDPRAFGLTAMVTSIVGLATVIGDFGLSLSALSGEPPSQPQRSRLFYINVSLGMVISLSVAAMAHPISDFYGHPEVASLTLALAPVFLLNAAAVQFKVEMNLRTAWRRLAATETIAPVVGLVVALIMASIWPTAWALIGQQIVAAVVQLILAVTLSGWRPVALRSSTGVASHLRFGRDTLFGQVFVYVSNNLDNVLIGRHAGAAVLGQYSRAFQIGTLPVTQLASPLTRVFVPKLSRAAIAGGLHSESIRCQLFLSYALLAPLTLMISVAKPGVRLFLGFQWGDASYLVGVLSFASIFQALGYIFYWIFVSTRQTKILVATEAVSRSLFVASLFVVVVHGSHWVAWCVVLGQLLLLFGSAIAASRYTAVSVFTLFKVSVRPMAVYGAATFGGYLVASNVSRCGWDDVGSFAAGSSVWLVVAGVAVALKRLGVRSDLLLVRDFLRGS